MQNAANQSPKETPDQQAAAQADQNAKNKKLPGDKTQQPQQGQQPQQNTPQIPDLINQLLGSQTQAKSGKSSSNTEDNSSGGLNNLAKSIKGGKGIDDTKLGNAISAISTILSFL
jgi:hypothetical protein